MMIRPLGEEYRARVHELRDESEHRLSAKGLDQFTTGPRAAKAHEHLDALMDAQAFAGWLNDDGKLTAVVAVEDEGDPDFWTVTEAGEQDVRYVCRFMSEPGSGDGDRLMNAVMAAERASGTRLLRLDCWATNEGLHDYYRKHGWRHVRTMTVPGRYSGALFDCTL
ncbi:MAG: hypothetical protein Q4G51_09250 [Dermatophilus congolensis]|nr:hypothetical protein [Dermatophilus congolensis]